jgi:phenylacetate-CoA ligase
MTPKARYNIGDEGRLLSYDDLRKLVDVKDVNTDGMRLPLLFLFGRRDSTISYMGANIYPQDVENGLYQGNERAHLIEGFCLSLEEHDDLERRPAVHLQLRPGAALDDAERRDLADVCRQGVLRYLAQVSRDFAESLAEDPTAADLRVYVHDHGTGPFAAATGKIKNVYLARSAA